MTFINLHIAFCGNLNMCHKCGMFFYLEEVDMEVTAAVIRKRMKAVRAGYSECERKKMSASICRKLMEAISDCNPERKKILLLTYYPMKFEVDVRPAVRDFMKSGALVFYPVTFLKLHEIRFYRVDETDELKPGCMGIMEPEKREDGRNFQTYYDKYLSEKSSDFIAVSITPGLAFDRDGGRIGYGGGFYDRFFAEHKVIKAGVAFHGQISDDLHLEEHDVRMDMVVTDD